MAEQPTDTPKSFPLPHRAAPPLPIAPSTTTPPESPPQTNINSLPLELLHIIIEDGDLIHDWRSTALVCQAWQLVSQRRLWNEIRCHSKPQVASLLSSEALGRFRTSRLWLSWESATTDYECLDWWAVELLSRSLKGPLVFLNISALYFVPMNIFHLPLLSRLSELVLCDVELQEVRPEDKHRFKPPYELLQVRKLSLQHRIPHPFILYYFAVEPLTHLDLSGTSLIRLDIRSRDSVSYLMASPNLKYLRTSIVGDDLAAVFGKSICIETLVFACASEEALRVFVSHRPSAPSSLRVLDVQLEEYDKNDLTPPYVVSSGVIKSHLLAAGTSNSNLKQLTVRPHEEPFTPRAPEGFDEDLDIVSMEFLEKATKVVGLQSVCEHMGIVLLLEYCRPLTWEAEITGVGWE